MTTKKLAAVAECVLTNPKTRVFTSREMLALAHLLPTGALRNRSPFLAAFRDSDFFATPCNLPRYHPDATAAPAGLELQYWPSRDYFTPLVLRSETRA